MESTLFPISAEKHIIFCIIATILFLLQFIRTKRWYQLLMAIAVPCSLLIYINPENEYVYYGVGVLEGVALLTALVLNIVQSRKIAKAEKQAKAEAESQTADIPAEDAPAEDAAAEEISAETEAPSAEAEAVSAEAVPETPAETEE